MELEEQREEALEWVLEKLSAKRVPTPFVRQAPRADLAEKRAKEVELWQKWKDGGKKPEDLDPLIKSFQPTIQSRVTYYKNRVEIPTSAIEHVHKKEFVRALHTWDPSKGTTLSTWITTNLKRAGRFIDTNRNFARIPENIYKYIGPFNSLKSELTEKLGYEPDDQTIHDHILETGHPTLGKLSLKTISRINKEQRKGLITKGYETDISLTGQLDPRELEVIHLIYHQLTPQERVVHEYTFGLNNKPKLSPGEIAKKLKIDNSKVSKLRTSILNKMLPYLER